MIFERPSRGRLLCAQQRLTNIMKLWLGRRLAFAIYLISQFWIIMNRRNFHSEEKWQDGVKSCCVCLHLRLLFRFWFGTDDVGLRKVTDYKDFRKQVKIFHLSGHFIIILRGIKKWGMGHKRGDWLGSFWFTRSIEVSPGLSLLSLSLMRPITCSSVSPVSEFSYHYHPNYEQAASIRACTMVK